MIEFWAFSFLRKILFLLSISFHLYQISIFYLLSPYFFSSNSTSGCNISCLMIYLCSEILISFILHQEPYLLFYLINLINLLFLLYLISISIPMGQCVWNFNPWFNFINFILEFLKSKFICILCPNCSQIDQKLVKEGQMYAPKNGHLDYGPPLFNLSIYQIFQINGLQYFIKIN